MMAVRLIIEGNSVYEIDEDCVECQKKKRGFQRKDTRSEHAGRIPEEGSEKRPGS